MITLMAQIDLFVLLKLEGAEDNVRREKPNW